MADNTAKRSNGRLLLIGPIAIFLVIAGFMTATLIGRRAPPAAASNSTNTAPVVPVAPALPLAPPKSLAKADLVALAAQASSDYAAGRPIATALDPESSKSFEVTIYFGCAGAPAPESAGLPTVSANSKRKTLTLSATPVDWLDAPVLATAEKADNLEAARGFWLPRPWTDAEACSPVAPPPPAETDASAVAPDAENRKAAAAASKSARSASKTPPPSTPEAASTAASRPTIGIVEVFRSGSSRVNQRGKRPYQFVSKLAEDGADVGRPYALRLTGRLAPFANGAQVACWSESPNLRPTCLIGVELDRVAFIDPATGKALAEWTG